MDEAAELGTFEELDRLLARIWPGLLPSDLRASHLAEHTWQLLELQRESFGDDELHQALAERGLDGGDIADAYSVLARRSSLSQNRS
jgi:hypothetical protein